ncbi:MAG: MogA/MoaB family molybdenum cofactor biosynthesis protein [Actinomycetota bacterium]
MGIRVAVITVSDGVAQGTRADESGDLIEEQLTEEGYAVAERVVVADEHPAIVAALRAQVDAGTPLIVTTGGTGFGPRDVTPEATSEVIERPAAGLSELMRAAGLQHTPLAALSRGIAGAAGKSLILNLPGSPKGVKESLDAVIEVLPHALSLLAGDTRHG